MEHFEVGPLMVGHWAGGDDTAIAPINGRKTHGFFTGGEISPLSRDLYTL